MLVIVSPAKKMDDKLQTRGLCFTQPRFEEEIKELLTVAKNLSRVDIRRLMSISEKLVDLNFQRFHSFDFPFKESNAGAATFLFRGDTYSGLDADSLSDEDLNYAQDHLRILSGLYGLLRPLDLVHPYRLEMGTKLRSSKGEDLYDFWGDKIAQAINSDVAEHHERVVINCASREYFKAVDQKALEAEVITPVFKEVKDGIAKVVSFSAKRARGMMARYVIQNRLEKAEDIKGFRGANYCYQPDLSNDQDYVFTRFSPKEAS